MSVSAADKIFLCVGVIGFGGIFVWIGVALHLAYTKMDVMLSQLKNCPAVMVRISFNSAGPWGRLFVQGAIMGLMTTPSLYLRHGGACPEDLENFPVDLKRKLVTLHWAGWVLLLIMCGLAIYAKFGRG